MIIVSACLAGVCCRFDGKSKPHPKVMELVRKGEAIPVCPEQLGGLPTPRDVAERKGDKVITRGGRDVTASFVKGAEEALRIAKISGCKEAILKSKSPSCGSGAIFDGTFSKALMKRDGVFAELLKSNEINVLTENDI
jgi:uncharacterized protein YbbK (DUF523 family)